MSAQTSGKAKPWTLSRPRSLRFDYTGAADSIQALKSGAARPLSLAAADFHKNGATDLVAGYSIGTHGALAVFQGATARVFETPEAPDFLLAGDFNRDGNADLLMAARRGGLYLLAGDGQGGFQRAARIDLPGVVTALAAGEFNAPDGLIDVAVGVSGGQGAGLLIFDGASGGLAAQPVAYALPAEANALALGDLDGDAFEDAAAAAGNEVILIHGQAGRPADPQSRMEHVIVPFTLRGVAVGGFAPGQEDQLAIAVLSDSGAVHVFERADPNNKIEWQPGTGGTFAETRILDVQADPLALTADVPVSAPAVLALLSAARRQVSIVPFDGEPPVSLDLEETPVALVAMPENADGSRDLALLTSGPAPMWIGMQQNSVPANSFSRRPQVNGSPDLTITKTHSGNFSQGQVGATYSIIVTNSGGASSSGAVTVTDTLPSGLTATAIAGTGWVCTLAPLSCTRSDALAASASYPTITLTVTVAANVAASVQNIVRVSGGGDANTLNNGASDPTTINQTTPAAVMTLTGSPQTSPLNTAFVMPLQAVVKNDNGNPVQGVTVTFLAPASGASGAFQGATNTVMVATDSSGIAAAPVFTANGVAGSYNVTASVGGLQGTFSLANNAGPAPTADSLTVTGTAPNRILTAKYSSPAGFPNLVDTYVLINGTFNTANACWVFYDKAANGFFLVNDAATALLGPIPQGSGTLSNSQCTLSGSGSSVSGSGNTLTMTLNLTLSASFPATELVYMYASDGASMNSGWNYRGTTGNLTSSPPTADSVAGIAAGSLSQTLTFQYSSLNGYGYLSDVHSLINGTFNTANACWVFYDKAANGFFLVNDAATALLGPLALGSNGSLTNSQCTLDGSGSSLSGSGNTLTMVLKLTFTAAFGADKTIFMYAADQSGANSGWQNRGSTATGAGTPPTADSVTGVAPGSLSQTLTFQYSSLNGYQYLTDTYMLINSGPQTTNGCWVFYDKAANGFYLVSDDATVLLGPLALGSNGTLTNAQCTLNGTGTSISGAGNTLTMILNLAFQPAFGAAAQTIFMYAADGGGLNSGWQIRGTTGQAPVITSANSVKFTTGTLGAFNVTTSGFPAPSITRGGVALPSGVTYTDNGNGTGTLMGAPAALTGGTYAITFTATNTVGSTPAQTFTLTVQEAPAITSGNATTFQTGQSGTFSVTTTGFPTNAVMSITESGSLPSGVTFVNNNNGTATLAGTPGAGTGGAYPITITANNTVTPNATQSFTLTVNQPPAITSVNSKAFIYNTAGTTFAVTTTGFPAGASMVLSETGTLPTGVTFVNNGGTATIAGTPTQTGNFPITITANNGISPNATQSFTISVAPVAVADAYGGMVDNTQFAVTGGSTSSPATPFVGTTGRLIANDLPAGGVASTPGTFVTTAGGSVTIMADGTFIYTPKVNSGLAAITSDSFTYTVTSNTGGTSAVTSAPATVGLTLAGRVWYVRNNAGGGGNGQSQSPFNLLSSAVSASLANDFLYVYLGDGTTTGLATASTLKAGQSLIGQGVALVVNGNTLLGAGSFPVIGNTVTLANNVTVKGLDINAGANTGISGTSVTGVNVTPRDVTTTTGTAVSIGGSGNTGPYSFRSISKNGGTTKAISLTNTAGTFTVTGIGATAGSGGTIANIVGADAVSLTNTSGLVSLSNMIIQDITASGDSSAANDTHSGVDAIHGQMVNAGLTLNRVTIQRISDDGINGSVDAVPVTSPPTATVFNGLTITNCTIQDTNRYNVSGHGDAQVEGAVFIMGIKGLVSVTGSTIQRAGSGLDFTTDTSGTLDMTVQSNSFLELNKETGGTARVGNFGISVVQQGTLSSIVRIGDPNDVNAALGNLFTNSPLASIRVITNTGSNGSMKAEISRNTFRVTDHSTPGVPAGSILYNFPQGGVLLRALGGGNYEGIFSTNTFDQAMHADGGLGQLSLILENGASEFIVQNNTFGLPWDAPVELRADGQSGGQTSAAVLFQNNIYVDGTVGDSTTDLGGQSPYEGFFVSVKNGGKLDLTMKNETLGLTDNTSALNTSFYTQTTAHPNIFRLFLQNMQSPRGFRLSQNAPTSFNLYRNGSVAGTAQGVLQDNGNRGGAAVDTTNPPAVTSSGTITLTNSAPTLPSIVIN